MSKEITYMIIRSASELKKIEDKCKRLYVDTDFDFEIFKKLKKNQPVYVYKDFWDGEIINSDINPKETATEDEKYRIVSMQELLKAKEPPVKRGKNGDIIMHFGMKMWWGGR